MSEGSPSASACMNISHNILISSPNFYIFYNSYSIPFY